MKNRIYTNGTIITLDDNIPFPEALATVGDKISFVGSLEDARLSLGNDYELIDLKGKTLMPGFVDGHSHFPTGGLSRLYGVDLNVSTLEDFKQAFIDKMKTNTLTWLVGHSFDEYNFADKYFPTKNDLDEISCDIPIFYRHISGHTGVANSKALEIAGLDKNSVAPAGGIIGKYPDGELNGVLEGIPAQGLVRGKIPNYTDEELYNALMDDAKVYASYGVTTAQGGPAYSPMDAELGKKSTDIIVNAANKGELPIRAVLYVRAKDFERLEEYPMHVAGSDMSNNGYVTMGCAKLWSDGDPRAGTGYFRESYVSPADKLPYYGEYLYTIDELTEKLLPIHKSGWQIAVHGNGDAGIETVLSAYENLQRMHPRPNARHVIIHSQYARKEQLARMKKVGVYPCFFISPLYHWGEIHEEFVGKDRVDSFCPCRSAEEIDLIYNLHTDCPITSINPFIQIGVAVTRTSKKGRCYNRDESVSAYQALKAHTLNASFIHFEENIKGSLVAGKLADMIITDENLLTVAHDKIKNIKVLKTIVGGKEVYSAS